LQLKQTAAIEHKTSPARLAQLLQPSLAFCFSLLPMTAYRPELDDTPSLDWIEQGLTSPPTRRHWLQAKTKCH